MTDADLLASAGRLLHGDAWQSPLSRDLSVADRTVRRWLAGGPMPAGVWREVRALLDARATDCRSLLADSRFALDAPES